MWSDSGGGRGLVIETQVTPTTRSRRVNKVAWDALTLGSNGSSGSFDRQSR